MSGSALALPGEGTVDSNDIQRGAVKTQALHHRAVTTQKIDRQAVRGGKLASNSVKGGKIRAGSVSTAKLKADAVTATKLADGAVTNAAIAEDSIGADKLESLALIPQTKLAAATGASFDAARNAAQPTELFKKGPLSLYAKCFTDTTADETYAFVYAATTAAGSLLASGDDTLDGDPFLDPATDEVDREAYSESTGNDSADGFRNVFELSAPDGTVLHGQIATYAKNGALAGGDGPYGGGDACLFSGTVIG
jgi:hypothetical protein